MLHKLKASVDIAAIQSISEIKTLKAKDYRVLFHLMGHLDGRDFKEINSKKIANHLELDKEDVKKALVKLIGVELLSMGSNEHVKNGYKFTF
jgi:RIO-like serine/threonine protein kinase